VSDIGKTETADVVIVGGGPTGLFLASELGLVGVRATVLERRTDIVGQPRALGLSCRTLEVLELRGLGPRFLARSVALPVGFFGSLTTPLDLTPLDTTYPMTLMIPQTVTEALLEARAQELGADLKRGWKVETVGQTEHGVRVTGANGAGSFAIDARYVVGADGARSVVRDQCGIGFPGKDTDTTMYFGDLKMVGAPVEGSFTRESEEGSVLVAA
jgi:2-polyprenyl-6-methoxyphenol hydroxylase-like FAD-dependent oxidoreductase